MAQPSTLDYIKVSNLFGSRRYLIEWREGSEEDISYYNIYRSETHYTGFNKVGQVPAGTSQYVDTVGKDWGISWFYKVTAVNTSDEESSLSDTFPASDISIDGFEMEAFRDNVTQDAIIIGEEPVGELDGTNDIFYTRDNYGNKKLEVIINGNIKTRNIDFEEDDAVRNKFKLLVDPLPDVSNDDIIRVNYVKQ